CSASLHCACRAAQLLDPLHVLQMVLLDVHPVLPYFFFLMTRPPPRSTLFPYTTLFRSVRGESISVGDFFRFPNVGTIVLVAIVLSVASALLSFTFILPVALMFFAAYTVLFALDRGEHLVDAITSSVKMALANPGQTILLLLLAYLANLVGGLLCGIGTLVSLPLTALATAWLYRSQLALTPPRQ